MPRVIELTDADIKPVDVAPIEVPPEPTPEPTPEPERQPAPSTPAVEPETPPEPEEPAAAPPEGEPAPEPADEDPELLRALDKVYGDKLRELPEAKAARERDVQAGVDRALAELRQQPAAHEDVIVNRGQAQQDLATLQRIFDDAREQGAVPDRDVVAGLAARHGYLASRAERFGAFETARAIVEHLTSPVLQELEQAVGAAKFAEARAPVDALYAEGLTQFRRFINAGTQNGRMTQSDMQAQERAFGEYVSRMARSLLELGRKVGAAQFEKSSKDAYEAKLVIERKNALQRARAEVQAGNPPPPLTPAPQSKPGEVQLGGATLNVSAKEALAMFERAAGRGK